MFTVPFISVKDILYTQYLKPYFDPSTGKNANVIETELRDYIIKNQKRSFILTRAEILSKILTEAQISIIPDDFYQDHLDHGGFPEKFCREIQRTETENIPVAYRESNAKAIKEGFYEAYLDLGHTAPDWERVLKLGFSGIQKEAEERYDKEKNSEKAEFYRAVIIVYKAARIYMNRLANAAEKAGTPRTHYVSADLRLLADNPPQTLHQALQFVYCYHEIQEIEGENVRSMGGFDRLYRKYYENDLAAGRLTEEQAKELIKYFFYKFTANTQERAAGKNFFFAGSDSDGNDCTCALSYLALEAYDELAVADPKFSIRVNPKTPNSFLHMAADMIRRGHNSIVFINEDIAVKTLMRHGKNRADAFRFTLIGCYEPASLGLELSCSMAGRLNLAKGIEYLMKQDVNYNTFEDLLEAYFKILDEQIKVITTIICEYEKIWRFVNPSPFLSGTMEHCMEYGRDVSEGGAKYNNSGIMAGCFASTVDSLAAIKELVYKNHSCTLFELKRALDVNWEDHEKLQLLAKQCQKWGNHSSVPDEIGRKISEYAAEHINNIPNERGGHFQMALFSIDYSHTFGRNTAALPDGRKAGMPLSQNTGASAGMDKRGITAAIHSVTCLDYTDFPDGSVFDVLLHPSAVSGKEGLDALEGLIRTYFALGGYAVHFNILSTKALHEAQEKPEEYRTLQIRVCGWNSYFVNLNRASQDEFIRKAEHAES